MRAEDGSSLPMACHLCGAEELQGFPFIPYLYEPLLLAVLWDYFHLAMERSLDGNSRELLGKHDADQLRLTGCHIGHHRPGTDGLYCLACQSGLERADDYRVFGEDQVP